MQVGNQILVRRHISLDPSETFSFKPRRSHRKWSVNLIQIHNGYFMVYGGPGRNRRGSCLKLQQGFRSPDEIPSMPTYIAEELTRGLEAMKEKAEELGAV